MLQATRVTERVRGWLDGPANGQVHSIFRRVCNLAWGDWLIPLHTTETGRLPGGVELFGEVDFTRLGLRPGLPVTWHPAQQCLHVGHWPVAMGRASVVPGRAPGGFGLQPLKERCHQLADLILRYGRGGLGACLAAPGEDAVARALWERGRSLCGSLAQGEEAAIRGTLATLLGLGPGLTPSGDDLVVGLMAVVTLRPVGAARVLCESAAEMAPRLTTQVSANYLRLGALGEFSARLEDAAVALLGNAGSADLAPAVLRLLDSGHSSGTDTAVGLYLGMTMLHGGCA